MQEPMQYFIKAKVVKKFIKDTSKTTGTTSVYSAKFIDGF